MVPLPLRKIRSKWPYSSLIESNFSAAGRGGGASHIRAMEVDAATDDKILHPPTGGVFHWSGCQPRGGTMRNIQLSSLGNSINSPSETSAPIGIAARSSSENANIGADTSKVVPLASSRTSKPNMSFVEYIQKL